MAEQHEAVDEGLPSIVPFSISVVRTVLNAMSTSGIASRPSTRAKGGGATVVVVPDGPGPSVAVAAGGEIGQRAAIRARQASSQRRHASAQILQCSCMSACWAHSSPHVLHASAQASRNTRVRFVP